MLQCLQSKLNCTIIAHNNACWKYVTKVKANMKHLNQKHGGHVYRMNSMNMYI